MSTIRPICMILALALAGLGGCTAQSARTEQGAGRDARSETSNSVLRASFDEMRADMDARLGAIEQRIEQRQSGVINIATSGGGLGAYVLLISASIVAWKLYRRSSYWKDSTRRIVKVIEDQEHEAGLKHRLAKINARTTPLGQLVARETQERKR